jgi:hypothetical protein
VIWALDAIFFAATLVVCVVAIRGPGRVWAHLRGRRYGIPMWTASGGIFYPLDARPDEVRIADIARALATCCRYQGQIGLGTGYDFYSVAEHSVLVSIHVEKIALQLGFTGAEARGFAKLALFHDGTEAYISDVGRPLKYSREMRPYRDIEARLERVIWQAIGEHPTPAALNLIKIVDNRILVDEIRAFMHHTDETEDQLIAKFGEPLECEIQGLPPALAEKLFLWRYEDLSA